MGLQMESFYIRVWCCPSRCQEAPKPQHCRLSMYSAFIPPPALLTEALSLVNGDLATREVGARTSVVSTSGPTPWTPCKPLIFPRQWLWEEGVCKACDFAWWKPTAGGRGHRDTCSEWGLEQLRGGCWRHSSHLYGSCGSGSWCRAGENY